MPRLGSPELMASPLRCQFIKRNGERCRRIACGGVRFCLTHRGRYHQRLAANRTKDCDLPRFYKRQMSKTLTAFVQECMESPPHEQLNLYEELALMRHAAQQAVAMYSACESLPDAPSDTPQGKARAQATSMATEMMKTALRDVAEMTQKAASIDAVSRDKISIHHIAFVISQITRIMHRVLAEHQDLAEELEREIRRQVQLPTGGATGVDLTPDKVLEDVVDMDDTIPRLELIDE